MSQSDSQSNGKPYSQPKSDETAAAESLDGGCGLGRTPGQDHGEVGQDTPPTNRVSNRYITDYFRPLRWGVDSLYLSFQGELFPDKERELKRLKQLAQSQFDHDQAQAQLIIKGHAFEVKDKGTGRFAYILEDNRFNIQLSRAVAKSMPMAYVRISSEYLTHKTPEQAVDDLRAILNELGQVSYMPKTSRIDLFVDFVSAEDMESWDRHAWVTRAEKINQYSVNGEFSGWTIGAGGDVSARLYNKLLELTESKKYYLLPLWSEMGWKEDEDEDVWRMEFQFRREILSQFDIQSLSTTLSNLNGLWSYATTEWLKLTLANPQDSNRARWPIHPLWACLASVDFETDGGPLSRTFSPERVPDDPYLFNHGFSVLSSFMAREEITDFEQGMAAFKSRLSHYLNNRAMNEGVYVDTYIEEKVAAKARRYNTILSKLSDDSLSDADEYRRQSDGE